MHENDLAEIIIEQAFSIHKQIGAGLLESFYEILLYHKLPKKSLSVKRQENVPFLYENIMIQKAYV